MTAVLEDLEVPDLSDPATYADGVPHAALDRLRAVPGLAWQPATTGTLTGGFWVLTRYREIAEVLQDPRSFSSHRGPVYPLSNPDGTSPMGKHILFLDPPDHSRVRRVAAKSFGPRTVANFRDWIDLVVTETLDRGLPLGTFDFVQKVAAQIPARVISSVMGVPDEDRDIIVDGAMNTFRYQADPTKEAEYVATFMGMGAYLLGLAQRKLSAQDDDMLTVLARGLDEGEIDELEFQLYAAGLVIAGFETTHTMMGHIAHLLSSDDRIRDLTWAAVAQGRTAASVDEYLRYVTPAQTFARTATTDLDFHGQAIGQGDMLLLSLTAANHDPEAFADPHTFDDDRAATSPTPGTGLAGLAFSAGPHRCIGHVLAKLELQILLEQLHARGVQLSPAGDVVRGSSAIVNQVVSVPVTVGTRP